MIRLRVVWAVGFVLFGFGAAPARGQQPFAPIPPEAAGKYRFDFPRNFFASPETEKKDRAKYESLLAALEKMKGKVASSAASLLRTLKLNDEFQLRYNPHYMYLYLRYAVNTKDTASRDAQTGIDAEVNRRTAFLQQELMRIDKAALARFIREEPALKPYAFEIESAVRLRPHTLSLKEEELLGAIDPVINQWQEQLYQGTLDRTPWAKVHTSGGDLDVLRNEGTLRNSADRMEREQGFKLLHAGYRQNREVYAFALMRVIKARNQLSQLRGYKDFPHEAHFGLYLPTDHVKSLFLRLADAAELNKRYQRLRVARIKRFSGLDDVNVWDYNIVPPGKDRPRFTIGNATRTILETLKPFGPQYMTELQALLDPNHGRLDIVPGANRVPGAFAWGFPGSQISIFYDYNFEGFYDDVSALIHESGHAIHYQLMGLNHVLPPYASGAIYFTESFAMFNELLLADQLYRNESDPFRKTYYLERFLNQAMSVFGLARQASIEQAAYDEVAAGRIKGGEDFDSMARGIGSKFSIWFDKHPELADEWITVHHFYSQPMYYVNYVYANFLALAYFEMYQRDPKGFIPKYIAMVRNGFDAAPSEMLSHFLGIDLNDTKFVSDAFQTLESRLKDLEALYTTEK